MVAGVAHARVRIAPNGTGPCSVFSRHPCAPVCSVFERGVCVPGVDYGFGENLQVTVESAPKQAYQKPDHDLDTLRDLFAELRACWTPPAAETAREGMELSVRFAFRRNGTVMAPPRVTYTTPKTPDDVRKAYRETVTAAFDHCAPLHFTAGLGGALAGRPIAVRYVDNRNLDTQSQP
jgi:hypothetical protein